MASPLWCPPPLRMMALFRFRCGPIPMRVRARFRCPVPVQALFRCGSGVKVGSVPMRASFPRGPASLEGPDLMGAILIRASAGPLPIPIRARFTTELTGRTADWSARAPSGPGIRLMQGARLAITC